MSKIPNFNPLLLIKAMFILFIGIGFGLLYLLYRTGVTSIAAWVVLSLITLFMCLLYTIYFTDLDLFAGKGQDVSLMDHLVYHADHFEIISPVLQQTTAVAWSAIETILYDDRSNRDYQSFSQRYTILLKETLSVQVDHDASRINRLFGPAKKSRKLYIDDDQISNFQSLKKAIDQYLNTNTVYEDTKRGELVRETISIDKNIRITTQQWKPKQTNYPWQLIYDVYGRDMEGVLSANNGSI